MRLIDADALQRKICGAKCGCEYEDCGNEGDCAFDHFIFHAPTIEAEPVRHGRWIFGKELPCSWGQIPKNKYHLYCSECLEQAFNRSEDNDPDFDVDTRYCPFCGCCMDGGVDE